MEEEYVRIDDLIAKLAKLREVHGNLPMFIDDGHGWDEQRISIAEYKPAHLPPPPFNQREEEVRIGVPWEAARWAWVPWDEFMNVDDLTAKLIELREEHGNLPVFIDEDRGRDKRIATVIEYKPAADFHTGSRPDRIMIE